ncbi:PREDICTED: N-acetyl-D-glucosamine kinase-like isoform X2 [Priapulus caudatus]|nr:PREDICTED: N-acetyl-D-glucosamine kinase-like isoform X2 [Priapulus caudatus]XP_014663561.1 PREDICTED: N-acetyl-D-glucosamine kinase-like isoform X2 [Priapulus caudatus]
MVGVDECQARIMKMIQDAKQKAGINLDIPLTSVGLSLSGGEKDMDVIIDNLHKKDQHLSKSYHIYNDTQGSIFSASNKGGMVMIAGTGTNCRVVNPDGSTYNCGGWGHLLGDEAGAYWISNRAIKYVFDADDNLEHPPADVSTVRKLMLSHYKLRVQRQDLLDHLYRKIDKPKLASFCKGKFFAKAATETGDMLSRHVFSEAGMMIAKHICALEPHINKVGGLS